MYPYRLCFSKEGPLKYISHLDLQRTFGRALRRTDIPVAYSRGFNPQPRLRFAQPLALGIESKNEYLDLDLDIPLQENLLRETLNAELPPGLKVKTVTVLDPKQPSLSSLIGAALYVVRLAAAPEDLPRQLEQLLQAEEIFVERSGKKGARKVDIRPFLYRLELKKPGGGGQGKAAAALFMFLAAGSRGAARPQELLKLLAVHGPIEKIYRAALFISTDGELKTPDGVSVERYLEVFYEKEDCD